MTEHNTVSKNRSDPKSTHPPVPEHTTMSQPTVPVVPPPPADPLVQARVTIRKLRETNDTLRTQLDRDRDLVLRGAHNEVGMMRRRCNADIEEWRGKLNLAETKCQNLAAKFTAQRTEMCKAKRGLLFLQVQKDAAVKELATLKSDLAKLIPTPPPAAAGAKRPCPEN